MKSEAGNWGVYELTNLFEVTQLANDELCFEVDHKQQKLN